MLDLVTSVILMFKEVTNIRRCFGAPFWTTRVIIMDGFSADGTIAIASSFASVTVIQNRFVDFPYLLDFARDSRIIDTRRALRMDTDFVMPETLKAAIGARRKHTDFTANRIPYPAFPLLARRQRRYYCRDGHNDKGVIAGAVGEISPAMVHDDRKSLGRWLQSQWRYMDAEAEKLRKPGLRELAGPIEFAKLGFLAHRPC